LTTKQGNQQNKNLSETHRPGGKIGAVAVELTPDDLRETEQRRIEDHCAGGSLARKAGANDRSLKRSTASSSQDDEIKVHIASILTRNEARKAQELSQSGHTQGKIVLRVAEN